MRRIPTWSAFPATGNAVVVLKRDYLLLMAVARTATKWARKEGYVSALAEAVAKLNTTPRKS